MKKPRRFGIWGNTEKPAFWKLLPKIISWAEAKDLEVYLTTRIVSRLEDPGVYVYKTIESKQTFLELDFLLALGGDGTILSLARAVAHRKTPILGIHLGELGFLAEVTDDDMFPRLEMVAAGDYTTQQRMVLKCDVQQGEHGEQYHALNDFVIDRGGSHRMITCQLLASERFVANYKADGIIIATPTGSTAYSLSAGGPIVMPRLSALVVTPICSHSLTSRPIVFPDDRILKISFIEADGEEITLAVDGQVSAHLNEESVVVIRKADYRINMIDFEDSNYFHTLRTKMDWGKRGDG